MSGWIKLHKKFCKWEWIGKPEMVSLFINLLISANYEEDKWQGYIVERGQVIFGRLEWAKKLGISPQSLRTCIERLKSTNEITIKSTNKFSIITIVKYEEYQLTENESTSKSTSKSTFNQPAINQQLTTPKEVKNIRKKEEVSIIPSSEIGYSGDFENFWTAYPRKDDKKASFTIYNRIIKKGEDHDTIIKGARAYAEFAYAEGRDTKHIKLATSWLNGACWNNDYTIRGGRQPNTKITAREAADRAYDDLEKSGFFGQGVS